MRYDAHVAAWHIHRQRETARRWRISRLLFHHSGTRH